MKKYQFEEVEHIMIKLKENLPFFKEKYKIKTFGLMELVYYSLATQFYYLNS